MPVLLSAPSGSQEQMSPLPSDGFHFSSITRSSPWVMPPSHLVCGWWQWGCPGCEVCGTQGTEEPMVTGKSLHPPVSMATCWWAPEHGLVSCAGEQEGRGSCPQAVVRLIITQITPSTHWPCTQCCLWSTMPFSIQWRSGVASSGYEHAAIRRRMLCPGIPWR